jgi:UDP-N-acetylmuramate--alanine ligase
MAEFAAAFDESDLVIISEIYPAGDSPIPGISGQVLAETISDQGHANVRFISELDAIRDELPKHLNPGDLVLTLGAGDIAKLGGQILQRIADGASSPAEDGA